MLEEILRIPFAFQSIFLRGYSDLVVSLLYATVAKRDFDLKRIYFGRESRFSLRRYICLVSLRFLFEDDCI